MSKYYCSGFDQDNAFGHGLGKMFKEELKDTKSIVYIPGSPDKLEKSLNKYMPLFRQHFKNEGIEFEEEHLITSNMPKEKAQELVKNASFIMLMGGDPFKQKQLCQDLELLDILKNYQGVMLGYSAGAMLMSKYMIITPCSEEYPSFRIEEGLNLDNLSIYPHNNTSDEIYPDILINEDETYRKKDLIQVAKEYGKFYLLQDNWLGDKTEVSIIKSNNNKITFYKENNGKIWLVTKEDIILK